MARRFERDHSSQLAISACVQIAVASSGNANHAGRASAPEASNSESALATFRWADRKLSISRSPYRAQRSRLAAREDLSIALHEKTLLSQDLGGNVHALHGIYCWRFAVDGELLSFEARFSYILDLEREKPIMHHHSSQIPRML